MGALFTQTLKQGDTWSFEALDIVNRDGAVVSSLTSWTARFTMRNSGASAVTLQAAGSIGTAVNSVGATVPAFKWEIAKTTTAAIAPRVYVADIEVTDPTGRISTLQTGSVTVEGDNSPSA